MAGLPGQRHRASGERARDDERAAGISEPRKTRALQRPGRSPDTPDPVEAKKGEHEQGRGDPLETSRKTDGGPWSEPQVRQVSSRAFCVCRWDSTAGEDGGRYLEE